eukprot:TRINITY_DN290_c0_g1_i1.p1 TRINITY_DN290_c0_g1~~TRINITY_DN290_c0_g1_i1.p1  ORF type:complete len:337 (+),score=119.77 TRINITY_DN290_c0_g1_i1:30-1013(+)
MALPPPPPLVGNLPPPVTGGLPPPPPTNGPLRSDTPGVLPPPPGAPPSNGDPPPPAVNNNPPPPVVNNNAPPPVVNNNPPPPVVNNNPPPPANNGSVPGNLPGGLPPPGQLPGGLPPPGQLPGGLPPLGQLPGGLPPTGQLPGGLPPTGQLPGGLPPPGQLPGIQNVPVGNSPPPLRNDYSVVNNTPAHGNSNSPSPIASPTSDRNSSPKRSNNSKKRRKKKSRHGIEKMGFMTKEGGGFKSWKTRFFKLKDGKVEYYTGSDGQANLKGELDLSTVETITTSKKYVYCIELHTSKRIYKFAADNQNDMNEWKKAFRSWLPKKERPQK